MRLGGLAESLRHETFGFAKTLGFYCKDLQGPSVIGEQNVLQFLNCLDGQFQEALRQFAMVSMCISSPQM